MSRDKEVQGVRISPPLLLNLVNYLTSGLTDKRWYRLQ